MSDLAHAPPQRSIMRPQDVPDEYLWGLAQKVVGTAFCPTRFKRAEDVFVAMLYGRGVGLNALMSIHTIAVINGRPSVFGDGLSAVVLAHPEYDGKTEVMIGEPGTDSRGWKCTVRRRGVGEATAEFTVRNAKTAGLWGKDGPWRTHPDRMLQWRARHFACRDLFADALMGLVSADEAEESGEGRTVFVPNEAAERAVAAAESEPAPEPSATQLPAPPAAEVDIVQAIEDAATRPVTASPTASGPAGYSDIATQEEIDASLGADPGSALFGARKGRP